MEKLTLIGNLGKDPEMDYLDTGVCCTKFSLAVNRRVKKDNEWDKIAVWYSITAWREAAESLGTSLRKGDKVYLEGQPEIEMYTDKNGKVQISKGLTVKTYEFLSPKQSVSDRDE